MADFLIYYSRKAGLLSNELGYLVKECSKQSVEGAVWFFFAACRKCEWIEEGTLSNKEPALDLGESWPVQISKGATGRTFSLRNHALLKGQGQGWIAFALQRDKLCYSWM